MVYDTVEDSEHYNDASTIVDSATELIIPSIVIHEYIWVMARHLNIDLNLIALKLREYLMDPRVNYLLEDLGIYERAFKMIIEDRASIKDINDYLILSIAIREGAILATFDRDLAQKAIKRGVRVMP
nr:PIN domain-containing protein [Vulcanisaeta sp. JCM 16159]